MEKKMFIGKLNLDGSVVRAYVDVHGCYSYAFKYKNSKIEFKTSLGYCPVDDDIRMLKREHIEFMNGAYCEICGKKLTANTGKINNELVCCKDGCSINI